MKHNKDYSVIVFLSDGKAKKWRYVHKLSGFAKFLDSMHSDWKYMNVYNRREGNYLKRYYKGNYVPDFI